MAIKLSYLIIIMDIYHFNQTRDAKELVDAVGMRRKQHDWIRIVNNNGIIAPLNLGDRFLVHRLG